MKEFITEEMRVATRYQSHLPALIACVMDSYGINHLPVLEIGIGHFSTPQLRALCGTLRSLISVESNEEWRELFKAKYPSDRHRILASLDEVTAVAFDVVFIDDSPGGSNRANHFNRFINCSKYVVVHDYHYDNEEHIAPILDAHRDINWRIINTYEPPTLIASALVKVDHLHL